MLTKVEQQVFYAGQAWRAGSSTFMSALQTENKRIDNIDRMLRLQKQSVFQLYDEMSGMFTVTDNLAMIFARVVTKLKTSTFRISEMDLLYSSLERLVSGQLPHFLVSHNALQLALGNLDAFLLHNHPELTILNKDLHFYFTQGHYSFVRKNNLLIIILKVPLTLTTLHSLTIYDLVKIPLLVLGTPGYISELATTFYAVAFYRDAEYYIVIPRPTDIPHDRQLDMRHTNLVFHKRTEMSCPLTLLQGELSLVKNYCGYHIVRGHLVPTIYRLTDYTVLLSNISEIVVRCHRLNTTVITLPHPQTAYELRCDCDLETRDFFIHGLGAECAVVHDNITFRMTPRFVLNLCYLGEFFSDEELHGFQGNIRY